MTDPAGFPACDCAGRPPWGRLDDDCLVRWPVVEAGEWEELRQCPTCGTFWFAAWPEELERSPILCRALPPDAKRLRDVDRSETLRTYFLTQLEEHMGQLKEEKETCKRTDCGRKRMRGSAYCIEHLIARRFGRHMSKLDR